MTTTDIPIASYNKNRLFMTIPMTLISLEIFNVDFCVPIFVHSITDYNL